MSLPELWAFQSRAQQYAEEFRDTGMVVIPFPKERLVPPVLEGYRLWLAGKTQEERECWGFDECENGDPDLGYLKRIGGENPHGVKYDRKHPFHFRLSLYEYLAQAGIAHDDYDEWLSVYQSLYRHCNAVQKVLMRALDEVLPYYHFEKMVCDERAERYHVMRALAYPDAEAKAHQDRSLLTISCDSTGGLWLGSKRERHVPEQGKTLIFAGKKMAHHTGGVYNPDTNMFEGGRIPAVVHGAGEKGDGEMRYTAVFFGHSPNYLPGKN